MLIYLMPNAKRFLDRIVQCGAPVTYVDRQGMERNLSELPVEDRDFAFAMKDGRFCLDVRTHSLRDTELLIRYLAESNYKSA